MNTEKLDAFNNVVSDFTCEDLLEASKMLHGRFDVLKMMKSTEFHKGQHVMWKSRTGTTQRGEVVKVNLKSVKILSAGLIWTVSPNLLTVEVN